MQVIEKKLAVLFDLLSWKALYRPFSFVVSGEEETCQPLFYIPAIRLFIHVGPVESALRYSVIWGKAWRYLPNGSKPPEIGSVIDLRQLIAQPALLELSSQGGGERCWQTFYQYREMPGGPSDYGGLYISRCKSCCEWSPQMSLGGGGVCRFCAGREFGLEVYQSRESHDQLILGNGWGESIRLPQKLTEGVPPALRLISKSGEHAGFERLTGKSWFEVFERMATGPAPDQPGYVKKLSAANVDV